MTKTKYKITISGNGDNHSFEIELPNTTSPKSIEKMIRSTFFVPEKI